MAYVRTYSLVILPNLMQQFCQPRPSLMSSTTALCNGIRINPIKKKDTYQAFTISLLKILIVAADKKKEENHFESHFFGNFRKVAIINLIKNREIASSCLKTSPV